MDIKTSIRWMRRWSLLALFSVFLVGGIFHTVGQANIRIEMLMNDYAIEETLVKGSQAIIAHGGGSRVIYDCKTSGYTYISDLKAKYWQGNIDTMTEELRVQVGPMIRALQAQFGDSLSMSLRLTHLGSDDIIGYDVERYLVEESSKGGPWSVREEVWLSKQLGDQIREVSEDCRNIGEQVARLQIAFLTLVYGPDDEELEPYYTLFDGAFPAMMRVNVIGDWYESKLIGVSDEEIPEDKFQLPEHYARTDSVLEVMEFDSVPQDLSM